MNRASDVEKASSSSEKQEKLEVFTDARFVRDQEEGVEQAYLVKSELVNACLQKEYVLGLFIQYIH